MPSFDIVSEVDLQEVDNAINQARKEADSRYDFRGKKVVVEWDKKEIRLAADDEYCIGAIKDILQSKLHRRGIDIQSIKFDKVEPAGGMTLKQKAELVQGIDRESAKKICKKIKDSKMKVQAQVQDEKVRVTSKSRDTLQECMSFIKSENFGLPLQFENLRS